MTRAELVEAYVINKNDLDRYFQDKWGQYVIPHKDFPSLRTNDNFFQCGDCGKIYDTQIDAEECCLNHNEVHEDETPDKTRGEVQSAGNDGNQETAD